MKADELRAIVYRQPFEPFRIHVKDGRSFNIVHPRLSVVGESVVLVGVPAPGEDPTLADHTVWLWLTQIDHIEPFGQAHGRGQLR
jgi:hypothetical protein